MIQVKSPGFFTTVQDLGRPGYGPMGVSSAGAADTVALRLGNRLLGNAQSNAALEMTLLGGVFEFMRDAIVAVTGSDFAPCVDGEAVPLWSALRVRAGQTLSCGPTRSGARCYLCVRGGVRVPLFLGSASTHILTGLGGFEGRALRRGDVLDLGETTAGIRLGRVDPRLIRMLQPRKILRVTAGPQAEWFPLHTLDAFYNGLYRVTEEANRMGLRLDGPPVESAHHGQMQSEGVALGAIQVPAGGKPIILFVEQQTTGGYPKIANVIAADLSSVGQLRPRDEVRFEQVSPDEARSLICEQERLLQAEGIFLY